MCHNLFRVQGKEKAQEFLVYLPHGKIVNDQILSASKF